MSGEERRPGGENSEDEEPARAPLVLEEPEEKAPVAPEGGLGILFLAAALSLALILSVVGAVAYFVMKR
jgi:hypothetical protein